MPDDPFDYNPVPLTPHKKVKVRYVMKENKPDIDRLIDDVLAKHAAGQGKHGDSIEATAFICAAANAAPVLAEELKACREALKAIASNEPYLKMNGIYEITEEQLNAANSSMIRQIIARAALAASKESDHAK